MENIKISAKRNDDPTHKLESFFFSYFYLSEKIKKGCSVNWNKSDSDYAEKTSNLL